MLEVSKPAALLLSILSLYGVFHAAFLIPATTFLERIHDSFGLYVLATAICVVSGLVFRESEQDASHQVALNATLPMRIFWWSTLIILLLFGISWYLESYVVFYRSTGWY